MVGLKAGIICGFMGAILPRSQIHQTNHDTRLWFKSCASLVELWRFARWRENSPHAGPTAASVTSSAFLLRALVFIRPAPAPRYRLKLKLVCVLLMFLAATSGTAECAAAVPLAAAKAAAPAAAADSPTPATSQQLVSEIAAKAARLLADGVRLRSVALGCQPPAGASLDQVAPGISRLTSRGFVIEMRAGGRIFACSATVDAQRQVLAAAHDIAQGQALSSADFELRWVDAFAGSADALSTLPAHGPFLAATAIRAGEPLLPIQLARPLAIRPGDLVTVLVKNGSVTVRTQLEARSAAAVGDNVSVINPDTGLPLTVTATGERTAELVVQ
jgi:flagella basal body P-ring formation protein FlgA